MFVRTRLILIIAGLFLLGHAFDLSEESIDAVAAEPGRQPRSTNVTLEEKSERLKALKAEVRQLSSELREAKIQKIINGANQIVNGTQTKPAKNQRLKLWKKRMQNRIKQLTRRMAKLERAVIAQHREKSNENRGPKAGSRKGVVTSSPAYASDVPRNRSRPGDEGSSCSSHNECRPGHCCHRLNSTNECIRHSLKEHSQCRDSCECENHLHCFRKNEPSNDAQPYCKKAHRNDYKGAYVINTKGIFDSV